MAVLHDPVAADAPPDLADNLAQAKLVAGALRDLGHASELVAFGPKLGETAAHLTAGRHQAVFNLVETPMGRARLIHLAPLLLERLGLAYTGAGPRGMRLTSDKLAAKRVMQGCGLPTPQWLEPPLPAEPPAQAPWLAKSVWEHGSVGLDDDCLLPPERYAQLADLLADKQRRHGGHWFAERYVSGREFNLSLLAGRQGPWVLPPAEIVFLGYGPERPRLVGYRAKWEAGSYEFAHTPRRFDLPPADAPLLERLRRLALRCWEVFGLRGWARVDFRVDGQGRPFILEVNANPCLAGDAGFMAAAARAGLDPGAVIGRILARAQASPAPPALVSPAGRA